MQDLNNIITELADRQSITDLLLAYCAACDRIDEAALRTLEEVLVKGRYVDRLIRTEQGWQILHRTGIHDFELIREVPAETRPMAAGPSSGGPADDPFARELAALMGG